MTNDATKHLCDLLLILLPGIDEMIQLHETVTEYRLTYRCDSSNLTYQTIYDERISNYNKVSREIIAKDIICNKKDTVDIVKYIISLVCEIEANETSRRFSSGSSSSSSSSSSNENNNTNNRNPNINKRKRKATPVVTAIRFILQGIMGVSNGGI